MCKYMGIQPYGTDAYLRYMLRKRLHWIKIDDKMIQAEGGVDALSEEELREDCRERGMLGLLSVDEMRQQLRDWLDLSLNHSVPSSLLILSSTTRLEFYYGEDSQCKNLQINFMEINIIIEKEDRCRFITGQKKLNYITVASTVGCT